MHMPDGQSLSTPIPTTILRRVPPLVPFLS